MKNTGKCPKCGGKEIIHVTSEGSGGSSGQFIKTGMTIMSIVGVSRYICANCGFIEQWMERPEDIRKVAGKFGTD